MIALVSKIIAKFVRLVTPTVFSVHEDRFSFLNGIDQMFTDCFA